MSTTAGGRRVGVARRGALVACLSLPVLATQALGAAALAHRPPPGGPRGARIEAGRLLKRIVLPRGARAGGTAADSDPHLDGPSSQPATPRRLDLHGFWHLPGDPAAELVWMQRHAPAGARTVRSGTSSRAGAAGTLWYVGYAFVPARGRFASEELLLSLARTRRGGTLLRADAQVVWLPAQARR